MEQLTHWLFDNSGFSRRDMYGPDWTPELRGWMFWSELGSGLGFLAITAAMTAGAWAYNRKHRQVESVFVGKALYLLYVAFIAVCGAGHVLAALTLRDNAYYNLITAQRALLAVLVVVAAAYVPLVIRRVLASHTEQDLVDAEAAARGAELRFDLVFEQSSIGMALVDLDGRFVRVNRALEQMMGYTSDELMRMALDAITHPQDLDRDLQLMHQLQSGQIRSYTMEKRYQRKDHVYFWARLSVSLVRDEAGQALVHISQIEDISERVLHQLKMAEVNSQLEVANKKLEDQNSALRSAYQSLLRADLSEQAKQLAEQLESLRREDVSDD